MGLVELVGLVEFVGLVGLVRWCVETLTNLDVRLAWLFLGLIAGAPKETEYGAHEAEVLFIRRDVLPTVWRLDAVGERTDGELGHRAALLPPLLLEIGEELGMVVG